MTKLRNSLPVAALLLLAACSGEKETVKEVTRNTAVGKCLSEAGLFVTDSVESARKYATDLQKAEGRKFFLQGLDLLVNKQKAESSIELFKEALQYYPDEKAYYYLAKAYVEQGDAGNAEKSLNILYGWGYDPYYEIPYMNAIVQAMRKDTAAAIGSLNEAIAEGFLNKDRLVNEKHFDFLREDPRYTALMVNTFNDDKKLKALLFKNYLKIYPELNLPYTDPIDSVARYNYDRYVNYDYAVFLPGMEDGRFSRDVTNEYLWVGKMKLENNAWAVVYKTVFAIADTLNPVKTYVITYDSLGTVVDNELIGCFCSPNTSKAYTINKDLSINSTEYKVNWLNDPEEKGYAGNTITSTEEDKRSAVKLNAGGIIKRDEIAQAQTQN